MLDLEESSPWDAGTFELLVWIRAEGKLFENTTSVTITDKAVSNYTYEIVPMSFLKQILVYKDDVEIYKESQMGGLDESLLLETAKNSLDPSGEDSDIQGMTRK